MRKREYMKERIIIKKREKKVRKWLRLRLDGHHERMSMRGFKFYKTPYI